MLAQGSRAFRYAVVIIVVYELMVWGLIALAFTTPFNDANWVSFGGAGAFAPHKTIRMLGEDINITIYDERIHVRVWFSFRNDGPATTVKMAFPFEDTVFAQESMIKRFSSKVDGEAIAVKKEEFKTFTRDGREFLRGGYPIARPVAYVKDVAFSAGQTRIVLVDYVTAHGTVWQGNSDEYVLRTGATWAGNIGLCTITVDWSKVSKLSKPYLRFYREDLTQFEAEWVFLDDKKATTSIKDFEPDFDLSFSTSRIPD